MSRRSFATLAMISLAFAASPEAQFRRGIFGESTEITLYPHDPPALLLPAGSVELEVRNTSGASARIVERLRDLLGRQLTDNDSRLHVVDKNGDVVVSATLTEWNESRRNSTKYVSERRQIGTREVTDKNGKKRTEPVYEYGRNKPSVVISANAGLRVEVRRRVGGTAVADETARHTIQEEHLTEAGPTRDAVEDMLIDNVVKKGAGRISPGRSRVRVLLARSDEVDRLNSLAQNRRWQEWLTALEALAPHRDRKRDAYRLHNLAVAQESIAYESTTIDDWDARLGLAAKLVTQAAAQNSGDKYVAESAGRIAKSVLSYRQLADLYSKSGATLGPSRPAANPPVPPVPAPTAGTTTSSTGARVSGTAPSPTTATASVAMSNHDVIELRAAGLDDDNLIAAIQEAKTMTFDLSPEGLKALLAAKVSNRVITAMRGRSSK